MTVFYTIPETWRCTEPDLQGIKRRIMFFPSFCVGLARLFLVEIIQKKKKKKERSFMISSPSAIILNIFIFPATGYPQEQGSSVPHLSSHRNVSL